MAQLVAVGSFLVLFLAACPTVAMPQNGLDFDSILQTIVAPPDDPHLFVDEPRLKAVEFPVTFSGENATKVVSVAPNTHSAVAISAICSSFFGNGTGTSTQCETELALKWSSFPRRPCYTNIAKTELHYHPNLRKYYLQAVQLEAVVAGAGFCASEGHMAECPRKIAAILDIVDANPLAQTVCEIGFNAGHSALAWLMHSKLHLHSIDIGEHEYTSVSKQYLHSLYPGRLSAHAGSSDNVLREIIRMKANKEIGNFHCDITVIDGSHEFQPTLSDLAYSRLLGRPGSIVLMDDVIENKAPGEVWRLVLEAGMAEEVRRVSCDGHPLAIAKWK